MEWFFLVLAVLALNASSGSSSSDENDGSVSTTSMNDAMAQAAATCGLNTMVIEAIERHETGNYTSDLWKTAKNPGGMKYSTYSSLGMRWGYVTMDDDSPDERFAKFPTAAEGILAHGRFLAQSRYDEARDTTDARAQINAIAAKGYATDPLWSTKVWDIYQQLEG